MHVQKTTVMTNGISDEGENCAEIRKMFHGIARVNEIYNKKQSKKYQKDSSRNIKNNNSQSKGKNKIYNLLNLILNLNPYLQNLNLSRRTKNLYL